MDEDDQAFAAYERSQPTRSVVESEHERIARGYPADEALLKHGGELEEKILRMLARHAGELQPSHRQAEILPFHPANKPGDT